MMDAGGSRCSSRCALCSPLPQAPGGQAWASEFAMAHPRPQWRANHSSPLPNHTPRRAAGTQTRPTVLLKPNPTLTASRFSGFLSAGAALRP